MGNLNNKISILIDKELKTLGDKEFARRRDRLIGEGVRSYGVETQEIRKIAKKYFKQFQERETIRDWLGTIKDLLSTKVFENQMAGIFLLGAFLKSGGKVSIPELERLIIKYLDNWATCDTISSEVVAKILSGSPKEIKTLYVWARSRNIWLKRIALVTIVKLKSEIENWQEIASRIFSFSKKAKEPIIKKAVRWLEKELS
ncbi:MAG: DNA alkylation repair protein [Minisyncoccia bacterium]